MKIYYLLVFTILSHLVRAQNTTFINSGDAWKYLDNGINQGTSWRDKAFIDDSWQTGISEFGYGDADEKTVVRFGANSATKYTTTYFRKTFTIADASLYTFYTMNVKRDDGIVVYVNGVEVSRLNMPVGTISFSTFASSDMAGTDESSWQPITLPAGTFVTGSNTVAVEIHQANLTSSDISFDLELLGSTAFGNRLTITRGPYLQKATSTSITLKWRTSLATDSKVSYGASLGNLTEQVILAGSRTDHTLEITGLLPYTTYYYSVGNANEVLQGDMNNHFTTNPTIGKDGSYNFWVLGDCGTSKVNQVNVRDKYVDYMGTDTTHGILLLGDNAYESGFDAEYQKGFFDIYQNTHLKNSMLWPAPGNHDYDNNNTGKIESQNIPYYTIFDTPENGESGGIASNNQAFYSYDYGNVHFLSLDSYGTENNLLLYDTLGAQVTWIKKDLAANTQKWTVAYWHHPPYTMGSHNSDIETDLAKIRQNFIRILERMGVDLILCGHSHNYERSKLMKGHYGVEATFDASVHNKSQSSGKYDGSNNSCPYHKNKTKGLDGTVYVVSGSAGKISGQQVSFPHNAMHYSNATNAGSLALNVTGGRLDAKFICEDGAIRDQFTILKDANQNLIYHVNKGENITLKASWNGDYSWSTGSEKSRSVSLNPTTDVTVIVKDSYSCITDTFNIVVDNLNGLDDAFTNKYAFIYPNPTTGMLNIGDNVITVQILDLTGNQYPVTYTKNDTAINISSLSSGAYIIRIEKTGGVYFEKFLKK